jgi:hypothetical protein
MTVESQRAEYGYKTLKAYHDLMRDLGQFEKYPELAARLKAMLEVYEPRWKQRSL